MDLQNRIEKYAELIIKTGLAIKKDDVLVIRIPVENYEFGHILAKKAFEQGAKDVKFNYRDQDFSVIKFKYASEEVLKDIPQYFIDEQNHYVDTNCKFISVIGEDPNGLKDSDPDKVMIANKASREALKHFSAEMMRNKVSWCVVGVPTKAWAKIVFPDLEEDKAVEKLWNMILDTSRVGEDPEKNWEEHISSMKKHSKFLNENEFEYLHVTSSNGTDLKIGLPEGYIFQGCGEGNLRGERFVANIPTEEVFSMPHKDKVDGIVYASKPLNYNGSLIENFWFKFENGKVVDFHAKKGHDVLKNMLSMDEGATHLGEVALVPYDSPISNTKILFYETLYDENASCHLALGKAYPTCIEGGPDMSEEELRAHGVNDSMIHVDFMFGYKDSHIVGVKKDGTKVDVFVNGNWA